MSENNLQNPQVLAPDSRMLPQCLGSADCIKDCNRLGSWEADLCQILACRRYLGDQYPCEVKQDWAEGEETSNAGIARLQPAPQGTPRQREPFRVVMYHPPPDAGCPWEGNVTPGEGQGLKTSAEDSQQPALTASARTSSSVLKGSSWLWPLQESTLMHAGPLGYTVEEFEMGHKETGNGEASVVEHLRPNL